jgi:3-oxoadipate enol-lactonase
VTRAPDEDLPDITGTTDVRGVQIKWSRSGVGRLAVYAHALGHDRDSLAGRGALLDLSPLSSHRAVLRYDARGHGHSSGSTSSADYAYPELARDLLALIDALSLGDPVTAIGTSMGTATVLHAATRSPGQFEKLVLTAPPNAWQSRRTQGDAYESLAASIERNGLESVRSVLDAAATPPILRDQPPLNVRVNEDLLPTILRGVAASDLPDFDAISELQIPVLILSWADDPTHPVETGQRLHELIPNSELQVATSRPEVELWPMRISGFLNS